MPELPEVETIRAHLEPRLVGRSIVDAHSHPSAKFTPALDAVGGAIERVDRRGKYLLVGLDNDDELIVHLGMTGRLAIEDPVRTDLAHPHLRAWWELDDDTFFTYHDARRFGRLRVVPAGEYSSIATLALMGPEPFDDEFNGPSLWRALSTSGRMVKTQLISQRPVAGLGNIYADEALWHARINPSARSVSKPKAEALAVAIQEVLRSGINNGGTTLRDYRNAEGEEGSNQYSLVCYGRSGKPCLRCGRELRRKVLDARTTTWCPTCQAR